MGIVRLGVLLQGSDLEAQRCSVNARFRGARVLSGTLHVRIFVLLASFHVTNDRYMSPTMVTSFCPQAFMSPTIVTRVPNSPGARQAFGAPQNGPGRGASLESLIGSGRSSKNLDAG
jgi:hypothetical protein